MNPDRSKWMLALARPLSWRSTSHHLNNSPAEASDSPPRPGCNICRACRCHCNHLMLVGIIVAGQRDKNTVTRGGDMSFDCRAKNGNRRYEKFHPNKSFYHPLNRLRTTRRRRATCFFLTAETSLKTFRGAKEARRRPNSFNNGALCCLGFNYMINIPTLIIQLL